MSDSSGHTHAEGSPDEATEALEHLEELAEEATAVGEGSESRPIMVLHRLRLTIDRLSGWFGGVSQVLVWVILVVGLFNVVTRYTSRWLSKDLIVAQMFEGQSMIFAYLGLFGLAYGLRDGVNPRVDFWWADYNDRRKALLDVVLHIILLIPFCWLALRVLWTPTMRSFGQNFDGSWDTWKVWQIWEASPDAGGLPRAPIRGALLLAFFLLLLQVIAEVIKNSMILIGRSHLGQTAQHDAPLRVE